MIESIQIGVDLATAASVIIAVYIFYLQSIERRESRRGQFEEGEKSQLQSEMWGYFKKVADRIGGFTIKFDKERRELKEFVEEIPEDENWVNENIGSISSDLSERTRKVINLSEDIRAYLLYDAVPEAKSLLHYYEFEQTKKDEILKKINDSVEEIQEYIKCIERIKEALKEIKRMLEVDKGELDGLDKIIDKFKFNKIIEQYPTKTQQDKLQVFVGLLIKGLRQLVETQSEIAPELDSDNKQASEKQQNAPDSDNEKKVVFIGSTLMKLRQDLLEAIK